MVLYVAAASVAERSLVWVGAHIVLSSWTPSYIVPCNARRIGVDTPTLVLTPSNVCSIIKMQVPETGRVEMATDSLTRLRLATAATRYGGGAATLTTKVRRGGIGVLDEILAGLTRSEASDVEATVERLVEQDVDVVLLGDVGYPPSLAASRAAPPALFVKGPLHLLHHSGIGTCGSRHATEQGLRAARTCSEVIASYGFNLVSGYARGVDLVTHTGALTRGGSTVLVLAEGIERFRVRRGEFGDVWDPSRSVVVSQFSPTQPWAAAGAMTRNAVIAGLSKALVVVEAGEKGGTLAAGLHALDRGQPVLVLQLSGASPGNQALIDKGATPIHSRQEIESYITDLPTDGSTTQLSFV